MNFTQTEKFGSRHSLYLRPKMSKDAVTSADTSINKNYLLPLKNDIYKDHRTKLQLQ
jgi:hypothetical protein